MLLFGAIACQIEEKYGAPRIILLFFISALGGAYATGLMGSFHELAQKVHGTSPGPIKVQSALCSTESHSWEM